MLSVAIKPSMLSGIMLSVAIKLNKASVIMLSVITLSVLAPQQSVELREKRAMLQNFLNLRFSLK
jgi:hypothetical protein